MSGIRMQVGRALGVATGALITPVLYPLMVARKARLIHPVGDLHAARVVPPAGVLPGAPAALAARLAGPALVRFSGSVFASLERMDSLGVTLRFYSPPLRDGLAGEGEQDLALVTVRSLTPPKVVAGVRRTHMGDYLSNVYHGVWPFEVDGFGRATLRLTASGGGAEGNDRRERLLRAANEGRARLTLEVAPLGSEIYLPVAEIHVGARLPEELQHAFRVNPSSDGRGLRPSGFLHGLRVVPYKASQFARRRVHSEVPRVVREAVVASLAREADVAL